MTGLNWCSDPHWRPQIYSCGLSERLDRFNFIGDIHNTHDQTRELLQKVGLWESHGKYFINGGIDREDNKKLHQKDEVLNVTAANTSYGHSKGSKSKIEEYYTQEMLQLVREKLYPDDHKLYQLLAGKKELSTGKELASQLSSKCMQTTL
eukprot:g5369.t1 g5369   contig2:410914-411488(-)